MNHMTSAAFFEATEAKTDAMASIGEIARHSGMSRQGLHWYEEQGLISPQKKNTYRKYSDDEVCLLGRIRFYHQMGFSLKEIDSLLDMDLESITDSLDVQIDKIRTALEREQVKLSIIEQRARLTHGFNALSGKLRLIDTDAFYFKHSFKTNEPIIESSADCTKAWVEEIPFTQYMSIAKLDNPSFEIPGRVGLSLPEKYLPYVSAAVTDDISCGDIPLIKSEKALYGLFQAVSLRAQETIDAINEAIGDRRSLLTGTIVLRPITCRKVDDAVVSYWEMWLPMR